MSFKNEFRSCIFGVFCILLSGCGGGGGGSTTNSIDSQTAAGQVTASPPIANPNPPVVDLLPVITPEAARMTIAAWGDSLTEGEGGTPFPTVLTSTFPNKVVFNGGLGGENSTQNSSRQLANINGYDLGINIFWFGRNNFNDPAQVKRDIASSVNFLKSSPKKFIILSIINGGGEPRGSASYQTLTTLNSDLQLQYPENYIDIRSYLISQYQKNSAQDLSDFNNDVIPASLRSDGIHLNSAGYILVANKVSELIKAKNW